MLNICCDARVYSHDYRELAKETRRIQNVANDPELAPNAFVEIPMP